MNLITDKGLGRSETGNQHSEEGESVNGDGFS
jgi:hypothetical protein